MYPITKMTRLKRWLWIAYLAAVTLLAWSPPFGLCAAPDSQWPDTGAAYALRVRKTAGLEIETEPSWLHLHANTSDAAAVGVTVDCQPDNDKWSYCTPPSTIRIRYSTHAVAGSVPPHAAPQRRLHRPVITRPPHPHPPPPGAR
jgi:hypothetical protein